MRDGGESDEERREEEHKNLLNKKSEVTETSREDGICVYECGQREGERERERERE